MPKFFDTQGNDYLSLAPDRPEGQLKTKHKALNSI